MIPQRGLVMVFALLVLLSISILGLSSIRSSVLQTKMASSVEKRSFAFDAAEAAIAGVIFESEDEAILSHPSTLDPLSEARLATQLNLGTETLSCFDDTRVTRNTTSQGMTFNKRHITDAHYSHKPAVNAWSKTVFVKEQACRGSSNVMGGSNINCHVFMVRGCGQSEGSNYAVANTLSASVFAPASAN